jgi:hypothetical protein
VEVTFTVAGALFAVAALLLDTYLRGGNVVVVVVMWWWW